MLIFLSACHVKSSLRIQPIDAELNHKFMSGDGLDSNYFSTKQIFQYYELENSDYLSKSELLKTINAFIEKQYVLSGRNNTESLRIFFYRKDLFSRYGNNVYESAREQESGRIEDENDNLVAQVDFTKNSNRFTYLRVSTVY